MIFQTLVDRNLWFRLRRRRMQRGLLRVSWEAKIPIFSLSRPARRQSVSQECTEGYLILQTRWSEAIEDIRKLRPQWEQADAGLWRQLVGVFLYPNFSRSSLREFWSTINCLSRIVSSDPLSQWVNQYVLYPKLSCARIINGRWKPVLSPWCDGIARLLGYCTIPNKINTRTRTSFQKIHVPLHSFVKEKGSCFLLGPSTS